MILAFSLLASAVASLAEGCHEARKEDIDRDDECEPEALQKAGSLGLWR